MQMCSRDFLYSMFRSITLVEAAVLSRIHLFVIFGGCLIQHHSSNTGRLILYWEFDIS